MIYSYLGITFKIRAGAKHLPMTRIPSGDSDRACQGPENVQRLWDSNSQLPYSIISNQSRRR